MSDPNAEPQPVINSQRRWLRWFGCALLLTIAAWFAWTYYIDWGPRPDVAAVGRVVDAETGRPLEGVFVQINVKQFSGGWHGGHMSCLHGEVIRTDADGRFSARKSLRELIPPSERNGDQPGADLGFYKPGWIPKSGNSWFNAKEGADYPMIPDRTDFAKRGRRIAAMLDGACAYKVQGQGWPELWTAIFTEGFGQYCDQTQALWSDISHASFYTAQNLVVGMLDRMVTQRDISSLGWPRADVERRLASFRRWQDQDRELFFGTLRIDSDKTNDPDVTMEAKQRFCSLFDAGTTSP